MYRALLTEAILALLAPQQGGKILVRGGDPQSQRRLFRVKLLRALHPTVLQHHLGKCAFISNFSRMLLQAVSRVRPPVHVKALPAISARAQLRRRKRVGRRTIELLKRHVVVVLDNEVVSGRSSQSLSPRGRDRATAQRRAIDRFKVRLLVQCWEDLSGEEAVGWRDGDVL